MQDYPKTPDDVASQMPLAVDPNDVINGAIHKSGFESELATADPQVAQQIAQDYPRHGNQEAANKIITIASYGPEYRDGLPIAELRTLAKYWPIDGPTVMDYLQRWQLDDDPEFMAKVQETIDTYL